MLRGFWTILAVGCTLAVIGLSMTMNYAFGYTLGTTELNAKILGALSVAFDGLKSVLPLFIAWRWAEKRRLAAALGSVLFAVLVACGTVSAVGFAAENRSGLAGSRENLNLSLKEAAADLDAAAARLKALPAHRIMGVIEADIAALQKDRLWDATGGCTEATATTSREFCKRIEVRRAELAAAVEDERLSGKIETLKREIKSARVSGAGGEVDPQAAAITRFTGYAIADVRWGLAWLVAIAVEAISALGLFVILRHHLPARKPSQERPWRLVRKDSQAGGVELAASVPKRIGHSSGRKRNG